MTEEQNIPPELLLERARVMVEIARRGIYVKAWKKIAEKHEAEGNARQAEITRTYVIAPIEDRIRELGERMLQLAASSGEAGRA